MGRRDRDNERHRLLPYVRHLLHLHLLRRVQPAVRVEDPRVAHPSRDRLNRVHLRRLGVLALFERLEDHPHLLVQFACQLLDYYSAFPRKLRCCN